MWSQFRSDQKACRPDNYQCQMLFVQCFLHRQSIRLRSHVCGMNTIKLRLTWTCQMIAFGRFWWQRHGSCRGINRCHVFGGFGRLEQTLASRLRNESQQRRQTNLRDIGVDTLVDHLCVQTCKKNRGKMMQGFELFRYWSVSRLQGLIRQQ